MMGHTDKATINQRRPLSDGMVILLRRMAREGGYKLPVGVNEAHSRARALMDRGLAMPGHDSRYPWTATDAGRARLAELDQ